MSPIYPLKWKTYPLFLLLFTSLSYSYSSSAQSNIPNARPTLDVIADQTTSFTKDMRFVELSGITPGDEPDQQVTIDVTTEDKDLIESIGADLMDNGKAFINYQLKEGAVGTATVKVVVTDNGSIPASYSRTFHIIIEGLNRELETKSLLEPEAVHSLKAVPNPALITSRIFFSTPQDEENVTVDLYTLSGAKVKQLFTGNTVENRSNYVDVNIKSLASGVYIVRLTGQSHTSNIKLVVAK